MEEKERRQADSQVDSIKGRGVETNPLPSTEPLAPIQPNSLSLSLVFFFIFVFRFSKVERRKSREKDRKP